MRRRLRAARRGARRRRLRRLRPPSDGDLRNPSRDQAQHPDQRVWAVFEPRSATSCRRVFQEDFARAFIESEADETMLAAVFRSTLPEDERLSLDDAGLGHRAGRPARPADSARGGHRRRRSRTKRATGDVVVIMSNGGFGGIHEKLLTALRSSRMPALDRAAIRNGDSSVPAIRAGERATCRSRRSRRSRSAAPRIG